MTRRLIPSCSVFVASWRYGNAKISGMTAMVEVRADNEPIFNKSDTGSDALGPSETGRGEKRC